MTDIGQELLELIEKSYQTQIKNNKKLKQLQKKINQKHPNYDDVMEYANLLGGYLSNAIRNNISDSVLPDGKMYYNIAKTILEPMLKTNYKNVVEQCVICQNNLNTNAKLGLKAVKVKYNDERTQGLIKYISDAELYSDREKSFLQSLVTNSRSVVFDSVRENADFHYQSGMHPKIIRKAHSGACEWCLGLAGTYNYEDVKNTGNDVFRKHSNCRCSVAYDPADGSKQVQDVHSKSWRDEDAIEERKQIPLENGLRNGRINTIKSFGSHTRFKSGNMDPDEYITAKMMWEKYDEINIKQAEKEYVYQELDNNLTAEEKSLCLVHRPIGNYYYTAINKGHNQYKIIKRELIDPIDDITATVFKEIFGEGWEDLL